MRRAVILGGVVLAAAAAATAQAQFQQRTPVDFMRHSSASSATRDLTFTKVDTTAALHTPSSVFRPPRLLTNFDVSHLFRKLTFPLTLPQTYPTPSFPQTSKDFKTMKVITSTSR